MINEVYLIGLDIIVLDDGEIKILEIQSAWECGLANIKRLTGGKDPVFELAMQVMDQMPNVIVPQPESHNDPNCYAQKISRSGSKTQTLNRGIEAMVRRKWIFNAICNQHPALMHYVPKTIIASPITVTEIFSAKNLLNHKYLYKPRAETRGVGIKEIPPTLSAKNFRAWFTAQSSESLNSPVRDYFPFLIQEYLHKKNISPPVIRVFAAVVWDSRSRALSILIANELAYVRIYHKSNDFATENNTKELYNTQSLAPKITAFLQDYFTIMLADQYKVTYRLWEMLIRNYIQNHRQQKTVQRINLLAQIFTGLIEEQEFTKNRLTHWQCFLLQAFLECYQETDAATIKDNFVCLAVAAFLIVARHNLDLYKDDKFYPLHTVLKLFASIHKLSAYVEGKHLQTMTVYKEVAAITFFKKIPPTTTYLSYCNKETLDAVAAVSKQHLSAVATYARW